MTNLTIHEQQSIYLTYRALFKGPNAEIRRLPKIKGLLESYETGPSILQISLSNAELVFELAILLRKGIFSSEEIARREFGALYDKGAGPGMSHTVPDLSIVEKGGRDSKDVHDILANAERKGNHKPGIAGSEGVSKASSDVSTLEKLLPPSEPPESSNIPSLFPIQLPFHVQHLIFTKSQQLLEECCFEFSQRHAPWLLAEQQWDCAQAIELNSWIAKMLKVYQNVPTQAFSKSEAADIQECLLAASKIRHCAVHRVRLSVEEMITHIEAAVAFAETLSDTGRTSVLREIRAELVEGLSMQEGKKKSLREMLRAELDEIEREREVLRVREERARQRMVSDDGKQMRCVGSCVEGRIRDILTKADFPGASAAALDMACDENGGADAEVNGTDSKTGDEHPIPSESPPGSKLPDNASDIDRGEIPLPKSLRPTESIACRSEPSDEGGGTEDDAERDRAVQEARALLVLS